MSTDIKIKERAFPIVIVGHIDNGKSTLIGRMLHDTGSLPTAKLKNCKPVATAATRRSNGLSCSTPCS